MKRSKKKKPEQSRPCGTPLAGVEFTSSRVEYSYSLSWTCTGLVEPHCPRRIHAHCSPPWARIRRRKPAFIVMNPHQSCGTPSFRELSIDIVESQSLLRNWHQSCRTWVVVAEPRSILLSPVYCGQTGVVVAESVSLSSRSCVIVIEKVSLLSNSCRLSDLRRRLSNPSPRESVSPSWNLAPRHRICLLIIESVSSSSNLSPHHQICLLIIESVSSSSNLSPPHQICLLSNPSRYHGTPVLPAPSRHR